MPLTKQAAIEKLQKLIVKAQSMADSGLDINAAAFTAWKRRAERTLETIFGKRSPQLQDFDEIEFYRAGRDDTSAARDFKDGLKDTVLLFQGMIEEIEDDWPDEPPDGAAGKTVEPQARATGSEPAATPTKPCVFIGHGRNPLWARLQLFLQNDLGLATVNYESESRVGESIIPVLEKMLDQATFAVLILTAEDETASGTKRARQNVIHEVGLFQGRLGFRKAILLRQHGTEDFSNVAGLQYISFNGDQIAEAFYELQKVLKREGQLP
ncbi:MAG TPA: nucleotide-binding protein [Pyrinomonadaceae bacterium]